MCSRAAASHAAGGGEPVALEARIISSARPGIVNHVLAEDFRRDLYAQLSVLVVRVPALRDYAEDVPELLRQYVDDADRDRGPAFPALQRRGAESAAQLSLAGQRARAAQSDAPLPAQCGPEEIGLEEVERELSAQTPADEPLVKHDLLALPLREAREQFERAYLQQQLMLCNGKVGLLAKRVDMERTHLYRKLRSLGIEIGHGAEE